MNALERLAGWAVGVSTENYPNQWKNATEWSRIALFDTLGVMIGGSDHPSPEMAFATLAQWGMGRQRLWGVVRNWRLRGRHL